MKKKILLILILLIIIAAVLYNYWPQPPPVFAISHVYNVTSGQTIEVDITISDTSDFSGWAVDLAWDPYILTITTGDIDGLQPIGSATFYNIYEGPFLKNVRPTSFLVNQINNEQGELEFLSARHVKLGETVSGSGELATINFTCINTGTTTIEITGSHPEGKSLIMDSQGIPILLHEDRNGLTTEADHTPPPVWTESSFQASIVIIEVVVLAVASFVIKKKR